MQAVAASPQSAAAAPAPTVTSAGVTSAVQQRLEAKFKQRRRQRRDADLRARAQEWVAVLRAVTGFRAAAGCDGACCAQARCPCASARLLFVDHRASTGWGAAANEPGFDGAAALRWVMAALYYHATGMSACHDKQVAAFPFAEELTGDGLGETEGATTAAGVIAAETAAAAAEVPHHQEPPEAPQVENRLALGPLVVRVLSNARLWADHRNHAHPALVRLREFSRQLLRVLWRVHAAAMNAQLVENSLHRLRVARSEEVRRFLHLDGGGTDVGTATAATPAGCGGATRAYRAGGGDGDGSTGGGTTPAADTAAAAAAAAAQTLLVPAPVGWDWGSQSADQTAYVVGLRILGLVLQPTLERVLRELVDSTWATVPAAAPASQALAALSPGALSTATTPATASAVAGEGGSGGGGGGAAAANPAASSVLTGAAAAASGWLCDVQWQPVRSLRELLRACGCAGGAVDSGGMQAAIAGARCTNVNSCRVVFHDPRQLKQCYQRLTLTSASGVPLPGTTAFGGVVAAMHNGFVQQVHLGAADAAGAEAAAASSAPPCPGVRLVLEACASQTPWRALFEARRHKVDTWCAGLGAQARAAVPRAWAWLRSVADYEARLFFEVELLLRSGMNFEADTWLLRTIIGDDGLTPAELCSALGRGRDPSGGASAESGRGGNGGGGAAAAARGGGAGKQ